MASIGRPFTAIKFVARPVISVLAAEEENAFSRSTEPRNLNAKNGAKMSRTSVIG